MLSNDDRSKIRQELVVAILGIVIGALTTFLTKFIESEYQYQRNLKVVEYDGECSKERIGKGNLHTLECTLSVQARGPNAIKGVELSVTASDGSAEVKSQKLTSEPNFAPPDPQPQVRGNALDHNFQAVLLERIKEPQQITWTVAISSPNALDAGSEVQRFVTVRDDDARIEQGGSWRWKRWIPFGVLALAVPLVISFFLLVVLIIFHSRNEGGQPNAQFE